MLTADRPITLTPPALPHPAPLAGAHPAGQALPLRSQEALERFCEQCDGRFVGADPYFDHLVGAGPCTWSD